MGSQLGVTVPFLKIYTKSKATYGRKHLIGGLFIVSEDESNTITASSLAARRQGRCWSSSWEFTTYPQIWGRENKTEPGWFFFFFETSKPTDIPPPTRPLLLILPKQSIIGSQTFKCTNLRGGHSQSNRYGGAVGRGGTAWLGEHNTRAGFQFVIKNVISQLPVLTPMLVVCCHIAILPCRLSLGP